MSLSADHLNSKSFSQCQQDLCVAELFEGQGRFIDVGARDPKVDSNSLLLEMMGWGGTCIDELSFDYSNRSAEFIHGDALEILARDDFAGSVFDYASLDVDTDTTNAVKVMLSNGIRFLFATIEHDKYMHGCRFQNIQHKALSAAGYVQMFIDVKPLGTGDMWFEDWWCDRNVCDRTLGVGLTPLEALAEIEKIPKIRLTQQ